MSIHSRLLPIPICTILLCFCLLLQSVAARPQGQSAGGAPALPAGVRRATSVEGITEYQLNNGLRVLLFPDPSKQTVTVNLTYLVGSRHEGYGEKGTAHLLEHMMFKGSSGHQNIPEEMTAHGARSNASTWYDRTNFFETLQATDANLEWALDMEADRMTHSFIAKKDLDSEMTVVRNEFELGENFPTGILRQRTVSSAFLWHNYGHDTIGARSDIEQAPIDRLQAFWRKYYQPDNAILVVAGKFDEAKALTVIAGKFGRISRPTRTLQPTFTAEPTQDGERSVTLRRVGDVQALCVVYHIPAGSHPDYAPLSVLAQSLSDPPSGRLYKALIETKKAATVSTSGFQLREPGYFAAEATVLKEGSLETARDIVIRTMEGIGAMPLTAEEVERSKAQLLKQVELNLNTSDSVGIELSEWAAMGDWRLLFLNRDRIRKVTVDDVNRVAAFYFKPDNRTMGLYYPISKPDRVEIPASPDIAALLKDYKGDSGIVAGEAFDPSPEMIARRMQSAEAGGMKLALLPKKNRGGKVNLELDLHFGDEKSLANHAEEGSLAAMMLMRGTARHTRQQIQDMFDRMKARVNIYGLAEGATVQLETTRENLAAVVRLIGEVLREPSFPESELDTLKQEQIALWEQQKNEPLFIAFNEVNRHLSPYSKGDPRHVATPEELITNIKAATVETLKAFHQQFYGASAAEMAIVGDFDAVEMTKLSREVFGDWKNRQPYTRIPRPYQDVSPVNQSYQTSDKASAMVCAGVNLPVRDDDPDYPALTLADYMLGGGFLYSRLTTRIRQKEGLSYGISSMLYASSEDESGWEMAYAYAAPQNVSKVESALKEEIARALKDGFTPDELKVAKTSLLQSRQVSRAQDNELASLLANYQHINRSINWDADFERKLNALTPDQVLAVMRKRIDPARITIIKAGDFAKAGAKP